ncbi:hypothetical protein ABMA27_001987 [Loxostege sticticalis]|uniref:Nucleolus and neural progenitor protein-like N-terminal domain-containing protein n=1 Tax=Loxostege sticticalis TaxID=481309 RepID=A0ABR3HW80_LOXSC
MYVIEPWNDQAILPPPVNTFRGGQQIDVQDLLHLCNNITKILSKQSPLHKESALLSRFLYKFDKKFRNDIGYRHFKKLNTALRKYLQINLLKDIENFAVVIPGNNDENYLPTRQMLEYILVRIMTFAKIMMRICVCSKQASIYYMDRVKRGESHWMSLMPYALLSRIWSITTVLLQHSCTWYSGLYPYLKKLIFKGIDFLPANYTLPTDLGKWIDIENIDEYGRFEWSHKKDIPITMQLSEDELTLDTILEYVTDINIAESKQDSEQMKIEPPKEDIINIDDKVDQGEIISREYFKSFFNNQSAKEDRKESKHCADNVTNNKSLDSFITTEEKYRNEDSILSLTKHLSFMQWHTLKTSLLNLKESLSNNRKIERKFKKIWKEKCLEYK